MEIYQSISSLKLKADTETNRCVKYAEHPGSRIREQRENHLALRVSTRGLEQRVEK